jgi:hypothetical protein
VHIPIHDVASPHGHLRLASPVFNVKLAIFANAFCLSPTNPPPSLSKTLSSDFAAALIVRPFYPKAYGFGVCMAFIGLGRKLFVG